jgi:hypothetical protein
MRRVLPWVPSVVHGIVQGAAMCGGLMCEEAYYGGYEWRHCGIETFVHANEQLDDGELEPCDCDLVKISSD